MRVKWSGVQGPRHAASYWRTSIHYPPHTEATLAQDPKAWGTRQAWSITEKNLERSPSNPKEGLELRWEAPIACRTAELTNFSTPSLNFQKSWVRNSKKRLCNKGNEPSWGHFSCYTEKNRYYTWSKPNGKEIGPFKSVQKKFKLSFRRLFRLYKKNFIYYPAKGSKEPLTHFLFFHQRLA